MLLLVALCLTGLAPGTYAAWRVHRRHGWPRAILAGVGVTVALVALLLVSLIALAPVAIALGACAALAALTAYDRGRLMAATVWTWVLAVCLWCAGWSR